MVSQDQLDHKVIEICNSIKQKSRAVVKLGKEYYYKQLEMNIYEAYSGGVEVCIFLNKFAKTINTYNIIFRQWPKIFNTMMVKRVSEVLLKKENPFGNIPKKAFKE